MNVSQYQLNNLKTIFFKIYAVDKDFRITLYITNFSTGAMDFVICRLDCISNYSIYFF